MAVLSSRAPLVSFHSPPFQLGKEHSGPVQSKTRQPGWMGEPRWRQLTSRAIEQVRGESKTIPRQSQGEALEGKFLRTCKGKDKVDHKARRFKDKISAHRPTQIQIIDTDRWCVHYHRWRYYHVCVASQESWLILWQARGHVFTHCPFCAPAIFIRTTSARSGSFCHKQPERELSMHWSLADWTTATPCCTALTTGTLYACMHAAPSECCCSADHGTRGSVLGSHPHYMISTSTGCQCASVVGSSWWSRPTERCMGWRRCT